MGYLVNTFNQSCATLACCGFPGKSQGQLCSFEGLRGVIGFVCIVRPNPSFSAGFLKILNRVYGRFNQSLPKKRASSGLTRQDFYVGG